MLRDANNFLPTPETKSDNKNKTTLGVIVDVIFLLLFQCCSCFLFSMDPVFTPVVLPLDVLRHQVSSPDTDSMKLI